MLGVGAGLKMAKSCSVERLFEFFGGVLDQVSDIILSLLANHGCLYCRLVCLPFSLAYK